MTRIERRLLVRNSLLGAMLTLVVLFADWRGKDGLLAKVENNLYDLRARQCQNFTPPPTDKLVHIDIDDQSLQYVAQWPWSRELIAELTDEMKRAGAKAIGFDVLFVEAEEKKLRKELLQTPVGPFYAPFAYVPKLQLDAYVETEITREVDGNHLFAEALRRFDGAILPASYEPRPIAAPIMRATYKLLFDDLLTTEEEALRKVDAYGSHGVDTAAFHSIFDRARKDAIFDRVIRLLDKMNAGAPDSSGRAVKLKVPAEHEVRDALFPDMDLRMKKQFPTGLFKQQYERAVAFRSLRRHARAVPEGLPQFLPTSPDLPPIPALSSAISASSYVNYLAETDGVIRTVYLWSECDGWLYPQFGMMLACEYLGVDPSDIELHKDHIIIPKPDGSRIVIPVFEQYVNPVGLNCGMFIPVPWFGPSDKDDAWTRMYDYKNYELTRQHLPMLRVWEALEVRRKIRDNTRAMRDAILSILSLSDASMMERVKHAKFDPDDFNRQIQVADEVFRLKYDEVVTSGAMGIDHKEFQALTQPQLEEMLATLEESERIIFLRRVAAVKALPKLKQETLALSVELTRQRADLRERLNDKALLVGFTATGRLDVVPTSMIPRCPGVIVHGAVFNAVLTGDVWTKASPWVTRGFTLLIGLLATAAVAYFHPFNALLSSLAVAAGYVAFNFVYLFDYNNYIVGVAAPLVSVGIVWGGCTLMRFIVERAERRHIEGRFRSYVDPALVNYVMENPDKLHLEGDSRELTVVFTDLAGFTTLSEKLKERIVPILNEYMKRMVTIIHDAKKPKDRRGYRNKFLGDGIMFFFGAPYDNNLHAADAVSTVLEMQKAMYDFNDWLKAQELPSVKMRAGVSTGPMVVGDAGSPDASDYTVLGDDVNFGARLESANKATGTLVMVSERTRDLCGDLYLFRPIAKLQVVGKTQGVSVFEPICYMENATEDQKKLVRMTEAMVVTFAKGDFFACLERIRVLDEDYGPTKLTALYRRNCENYLTEPPGEKFDGTIALSEK